MIARGFVCTSRILYSNSMIPNSVSTMVDKASRGLICRKLGAENDAIATWLYSVFFFPSPEDVLGVVVDLRPISPIIALVVMKSLEAWKS